MEFMQGHMQPHLALLSTAGILITLSALRLEKVSLERCSVRFLFVLFLDSQKSLSEARDKIMNYLANNTRT